MIGNDNTSQLRKATQEVIAASRERLLREVLHLKTGNHQSRLPPRVSRRQHDEEATCPDH
jgi:hypothetical protein